MKNIRKSLLILVFIFVVLIMSACKKDEKIKIGILQFVTHEAIDSEREGFVTALEEAGYIDGKNIIIQVLNPQTDANTMQIQAAKLVRESDLILAIATPAAQAVVTEARGQGKNTPILFTAVTDPVDAGLITSMAAPGANVTGTSDMNPVATQINLVKELLPEATKVGILYTSSESNSEIQANLARQAALAIGLTPTVVTITTANDITLAVSNLITNSLVNAIYIPTDNLLASSMGAVEEVIRSYASYKVPIIGGETSQVRAGASIAYGLSYYNLGRDTGAMAVRILNGTNPSKIPSTTVQTVELVINKKQLENDLGIVIPTSLLERADEILD